VAFPGIGQDDALALLRTPKAFDLLFEAVAKAPLTDALAAADALSTYRHIPGIAAQVREAAKRRGTRELVAAVEETFPEVEPDA
jgi:hypothetical protein